MEEILTTMETARLISELSGRQITTDGVRFLERSGKISALKSENGTRVFIKEAVITFAEARKANLRRRG